MRKDKRDKEVRELADTESWLAYIQKDEEKPEDSSADKSGQGKKDEKYKGRHRK